MVQRIGRVRAPFFMCYVFWIQIELHHRWLNRRTPPRLRQTWRPVKLFQQLLPPSYPITWSAAHRKLGQLAKVKHVGNTKHRFEIPSNAMRHPFGILWYPLNWLLLLPPECCWEEDAKSLWPLLTIRGPLPRVSILPFLDLLTHRQARPHRRRVVERHIIGLNVGQRQILVSMVGILVEYLLGFRHRHGSRVTMSSVTLGVWEGQAA